MWCAKAGRSIARTTSNFVRTAHRKPVQLLSAQSNVLRTGLPAFCASSSQIMPFGFSSQFPNFSTAGSQSLAADQGSSAGVVEGSGEEDDSVSDASTKSKSHDGPSNQVFPDHREHVRPATWRHIMDVAREGNYEEAVTMLKDEIRDGRYVRLNRLCGAYHEVVKGCGSEIGDRFLTEMIDFLELKNTDNAVLTARIRTELQVNNDVTKAEELLQTLESLDDMNPSRGYISFCRHAGEMQEGGIERLKELLERAQHNGLKDPFLLIVAFFDQQILTNKFEEAFDTMSLADEYGVVIRPQQRVLHHIRLGNTYQCDSLTKFIDLFRQREQIDINLNPVTIGKLIEQSLEKHQFNAGLRSAECAFKFNAFVPLKPFIDCGFKLLADENNEKAFWWMLTSMERLGIDRTAHTKVFNGFFSRCGAEHVDIIVQLWNLMKRKDVEKDRMTRMILTMKQKQHDFVFSCPDVPFDLMSFIGY